MTLLMVARASVHAPVIVAPDTPSATEAALVSAFEDAESGVEIRPLSRLATLSSLPRAFVAIGDDANDAVAARWPDIHRAALLVWNLDSPATREANLVVTARPEPVCTAEALDDHADGPWVVLAATREPDAVTLAERLGGELVVGGPAQARSGLTAAFERGARNVWLRSSATHMVPAWLRYLARLARLPGVYIGTDAAGLSRVGFEVPVAVDTEAVATRTSAWLRALRRRRRVPRSVEGGPCRT